MGSCERAALALGFAIAAAAGPALAQPGGAASSRAAIVRADPDEHLQWGASVVRLDPLRRQGLTAKLFGTAGGDPAMNGLYTYLAFYEFAPGDGWRVFRLGDFLSYRVLEEAPGRLLLEIRESVMDESTGSIGARTRRLAISWSGGGGDEPPASLSVTQAR